MEAQPCRRERERESAIILRIVRWAAVSEPTYSKRAKYVHANTSSLVDGKEIEQKGKFFWWGKKLFHTPPYEVSEGRRWLIWQMMVWEGGSLHTISQCQDLLNIFNSRPTDQKWRETPVYQEILCGWTKIKQTLPQFAIFSLYGCSLGFLRMSSIEKKFWG